MMHLAIRRVALRILRHTPLLVAVIVSLVAGAAFAAAGVGDQVDLKATHQAGVPLHQQPRGTNDFQRVPDGTRAIVLKVAPDGRWVKLSLPNGRTS
jgi:hypothetical protein